MISTDEFLGNGIEHGFALNKCAPIKHCIESALLSNFELKVVYSLVLNRSHMATIWNFDPSYSLPNVARPKSACQKSSKY